MGHSSLVLTFNLAFPFSSLRVLAVWQVRVLKEQARKQKDKYNKTESKLKDTQAELSKSQRQVKKMREVMDKKDLGEKDDMARKITSLESELEDSRKRVSVSV